MRNTSKYDEKECESVWVNYKEDYNGKKITIKRIHNIVKKTDIKAYHALFPVTLTLNRPQESLQELPIYDPKEKYYWYDYVKEFNGKAYHIKVDSADSVTDIILPHVLDEMKMEIAKCARVIISTDDKFHTYFKMDDKRLFFLELLPRYMTHNKYKVKIIFSWKDDKGEDQSQIKEHSIYNPLYLCTDLWCDMVDMIPFHDDLRVNIPKNVFNLFPGFKAKRVEWSDEKYALITPFLTHIFEVWANSNTEYYLWILAWLQYPLLYLTRSSKMLYLLGKQGAGKTLPFELIREFVYGFHSALIVKSFDDILQKFNEILIGKMLVIVDEAASVTEGSMTKKESNSQKGMVTANYTVIGRKHRTDLIIPNVLNFGVCTNNKHCADLDPDARREGMMQCNEKYMADYGYFDNLVKGFTQDAGDALYTYLRDVKGLPSIEKVPMTELKRNIINMSKSKASVFFDGLFDGSIQIPRDIIHIENTMVGVPDGTNTAPFAQSNSFYFIVTTILYNQVYKPWHKNYSTGVPWSERAFSDNLFDYDKMNIVRGRKRTNKITGPTVYFSSKLLNEIVVVDTILIENGGFTTATDEFYPLIRPVAAPPKEVVAPVVAPPKEVITPVITPIILS
jgi:hypothetical protein